MDENINDYELYKDGELVNTIVADEEFIIDYAASMGYTYKLRPKPPEPEPQPYVPTPSTDDKINAIVERQEFLEDCIAEMALNVYS